MKTWHATAQEFGLVDHLNAELLRLLELAAGLFAGDHEISFL